MKIIPKLSLSLLLNLTLMFLLRNKKKISFNYPQYALLSGTLYTFIMITQTLLSSATLQCFSAISAKKINFMTLCWLS